MMSTTLPEVPNSRRLSGDRPAHRLPRFTEIKSAERVATSIDVFNLSVDGTQTFYVTDGTDVYLVHNK